VAWAEAPNGTDADIFIRRIMPPNGAFPDIGPRLRVNSDVGAADQFFPWLSVDSSNGAVEVAFYDRRDTGGMLMNLFLARSTNGAASFDEETRITTALSDPNIQSRVTGTTGTAIQIGDYLALKPPANKA